MRNDKTGHASLGYLTKEGFRGIWVNKLMSFASVAVLMSCLLLIGAAYMLFVNINVLLGNVTQQNVIMVYIMDEATQDQAAELGRRIESLSNVKKCTFVPKEEAYPKYIESLGSSSRLFDGLENPLPDAYEISVSDMALYADTVAELSKLDNVDDIYQNGLVAQELTALKKTVGTISVVVIVMLFVVSLFIISNTVRITMFSRRLEIMIMKSVGATKWFIRWPFVVEGVVLGVIAGVASLGAVWGLYNALISAIAKMGFLSILSAKPVPFAGHALVILPAFLAMGVLTGTFGSYVSMNKYLKEQSYDSENVSVDNA